MKIKKGDKVMVVAGKDKGKTGTVLRALPTLDQVIIEGVNVATRHQKNRRIRATGQIIEKSMPIHISNVALVEGKKPVRVGYKTEDGKKVRVSRASGTKI
jgi:large subunit ribosomal protein L24